MNQQRVNDKCLELIETLLKNGYSYQIPKKEIENAMIICNLGLDDRTWKRWIRALEVLEYIKPINPRIYELNPTRIPRLFEMLRKLPQTHISTPSLSQKIEKEEV